MTTLVIEAFGCTVFAFAVGFVISAWVTNRPPKPGLSADRGGTLKLFPAPDRATDTGPRGDKAADMLGVVDVADA